MVNEDSGPPPCCHLRPPGRAREAPKGFHVAGRRACWCTWGTQVFVIKARNGVHALHRPTLPTRVPLAGKDCGTSLGCSMCPLERARVARPAPSYACWTFVGAGGLRWGAAAVRGPSDTGSAHAPPGIACFVSPRQMRGDLQGYGLRARAQAGQGHVPTLSAHARGLEAQVLRQEDSRKTTGASTYRKCLRTLILRSLNDIFPRSQCAQTVWPLSVGPCVSCVIMLPTALCLPSWRR